MAELQIVGGSSWSDEVIVYKDENQTAGNEFDLTGYTVKAVIKTAPAGELVTVTANIADAAKGKIYLQLTPTQTAQLFTTALSFEDVKTYMLGVEISKGTDVQEIVREEIDVIPEVVTI